MEIKELWVSAIKSLPNPFKVVACKYTPDSPDPRKDTELHWGFVNAEGKWMGRNWDHHQVEWLNENALSELKAQADKMAEVLLKALAIKDIWLWHDVAEEFREEAIALTNMQHQFEMALADYQGKKEGGGE